VSAKRICRGDEKPLRKENSMTRYHGFYPLQGHSVALGRDRAERWFGLPNADSAMLQQMAQQSERKRIAQELHDTLLQGFTGVALKLDALANSLPPALAKTKNQLQRALEEMDQHLTEARRSIWKLRSSALENTDDLAKALSKVSERAVTGTGIDLIFFVRGEARKLENDFEDNLLRVCEEAVANAVKHAEATRVEVTLEFNSGDVHLSICDDGCGFDAKDFENSKPGHFGMLGMTERVEALAGMLSIESASGRGTHVRATIPTDGTARRTFGRS
jgi:signal transduction histidine kinase